MIVSRFNPNVILLVIVLFIFAFITVNYLGNEESDSNSSFERHEHIQVNKPVKNDAIITKYVPAEPQAEIQAPPPVVIVTEIKKAIVTKVEKVTVFVDGAGN